MVGKNNLKVKKEKQSNKFYRYSIRRLSVGVASVAVAAGLLFASDSAVAQAATNEVKASTVETPSAPAPVADPKPSEVVTAPVASPAEDKAVPTPVAEEAKLTEEKAEEKPAQPEADKKSEEKTQAEKVKADAEAEKTEAKKAEEQAKSEKAAKVEKADSKAANYAADENEQPEELKFFAAEDKKEKDTNEPAPTADLTFGLKSGAIEEKKAEEAVANKASLPKGTKYEWVKKPQKGDKEAHVKVTYPDKSYDILTLPINTPDNVPAEAANGTELITGGGTSEADAIDATGQNPDATQIYRGKAWIENEPAFGSEDKGDVPAAGQKVYLQWKDGKGVVSPIFYTVVKPDGSFIFDLSRPVILADGSVTQYKLAGDPNFGVRTWASPMEGYSVVKSGDMYGARFQTRLDRTQESWDFTAGINRIVNGVIQYERKPNVEGWLAKPKDQWVRPNTPDGYWPDDGIYGTMRGKVWYEVNESNGGVTNEYLGQPRNGDIWATGMEVVGSYVNDHVARQFDAWKAANKGYTHQQFKEAQQKIISEYEQQYGKSSAIAETVVGKVDKDGKFRIPFRGLYGASRDRQHPVADVAHKVSDEEYGKLVKDEDINHKDSRVWDGVVNLKNRHINYDYSYVYPLSGNRDTWMKMYEDNMFQTSYSIGGQLNAGTDIDGIQFALLAAQPVHDVTNYDTNAKFARPGDTAQSSTKGLHPSQPYKQRWFRNGKPVGEVTEFTTDEKGEYGSIPITVPNDLEDDVIYTSGIFASTNKANKLTDALYADSFIARPPVKKVNKDDEVKRGYVRVSFLPGNSGKFDGDKQEVYYDILKGKTIQEAIEDSKGSAAPLVIPNVTPNDPAKPFKGWKENSNNENTKVYAKDLSDYTKPLEEGRPVTFVAEYNAVKEKDLVDPKYTPVHSNVGEEVTSTPTFIDQADKDTVKPEGAKFALGENAPEGAKVDPNTGVVTYTAKAADAGTMVSVPVVVTYKDGSQDTTNAPVIVAEQDKIKDVTDPNSPVPEGYVRLKFNADTKDGSVTGKFADNSKVKAFDVLKGTKFNDPEIQTKFDQVVPTNPVADNPAKKWSSWEPIFDNELAKDTSVEEGLKGDTREYHSVYEDKRFNEDNVGIAKVEIVQEPTKKEYTEGKEGDNKLDPAGTKVKLTDANGVEKVVGPEEFDKYGVKVGLKDVPNYTTDTPLTKKDHDGKKVEVTVPGKNGELKAESKAPITVKQQDKDALEPSYEPTEANVGQAAKSKAPSFKDSANKPADTPAGAIFALGEGAPKGATIDPKTGEVSYTPQAADEGKDVKIPVVVTYGDKTTDTTEATFNVALRPDVYKPTDPNAPVPEGYHKVTLKAGEGTQVAEKVLHVRDGKGISADSYPEATIAPSKAKDYKEPITWSVAPDTPISKDEVIVANATKKTDAEKNEPQAKDQTVKVGETPKAEDSIANLKDLPQGTKVAYKDPVDTKTPGEKPTSVVVTYPDGSSEEVPAKVQVKDLTDAEKNDPQGQDINIKVGETPNAKDGIKNADKLPKGTTFDFKQPVDTKTPGDKPATVVVTYPDGSKDEVPVTVKVTKNPTQSETTDPTVPAKTEVEDKTNLTPEEKAEVKKKVEDANKGKFPEAKPGQNPTTVEVGPDGTATITYPDGSKDTIPGTDLVVERPKTTVEGQPKTVKPTNDPQDTGLVVKNKDDKTPTKVTAKDEDGQDVPVTVDPETGKVSVTPGTNVDGPITVTVEDKDLPDGKQTFEVPVEGHEKGRDDNHSGKTQADLTDPTVPAKTEVEDKTNLTDDEKAKVKKAVEDANKDKFPAPKEGQNPTTVEVGKDGTATITYPDGSKDTIPGKDLVVERPKTTVEGTPKTVKPTNDPQDTGLVVKNKDDKTPTKVTAKDEDGQDVPVTVDPETGKVSVTPGTNVDGPITVTVEDKDLPDGKQTFEVPVEGHEKGRDDNHSGKTQADLTDPTVPSKTEVEDKNHLTDDEKAKVKKAVEDANKDKFPAPKEGQNPTTVEVGKDGTATITYPDGSKDTIPGKDLVVERPKTTVEGTPKTVKPTNDPQDTGLVVKNKDDKTPTKVTAKDEDGQDVPVTVDPETGKVSVTPGTNVDGPITVTVEDKDLPDGKQSFEVPVEGHEKGRDDNHSGKIQADLTDPTVPAEKTPVADKNHLTEDEKNTVKKAIEDVNKDKFPAPKEGQNPTTVTVDDKGNATITYPDGSKDTIPGDQLVREKTNVDDSAVKAVNPTDEKQGTGVKVNNPDKDTKATAKDEDGKDVPVVINPETGEVEVTPGKNVDGPITVTVTDPDLPGGKKEVTVPVNGHKAGRDDNGSDKTQADLTDPTVPSKTEVEDKNHLTDDEKAKVKKAVEDANKDKFPTPKEGQNPTKVEIGNDGTATITYPDGSKDTIPGTDLVVERPKTTVEGEPKTVKPTNDPQDTGLVVKNKDDKTPTKVTAKDEDGQDVPVTVDPETGKVSVTPGTKVDGPITVTVEDKDLPDGKQTFEVPVEGHEKGRDDNGSDKTQADLTDPTVPAEKTPVADKNHLTDDEKAQVKKAIEDANKDKFPAAKEGQNPTKVEVGDDGTATITYPDGSKDTFPGTDLVREKTKVEGTAKEVNPTDDVQDTGLKVTNKKAETKVTAKDEDGQDIPVTVGEDGSISVKPGTKVDGPITVTVEDPDLPGGKQEITVPVKGHQAGRDDNGSDKTQADLTDPVVPADKTPVADKNHLTDDEKAQVKKAIEDANKDKFPVAKEGQKPTKVEIGNDGTATITYPDGSQDTVPGRDLVREKTNVDSTAVKAVDPTDVKQGTGIKVNNPDKDTVVTAKDEDGKDVPVVINPETGEVEVTPGANVDGPITVTVEDPDLPGGKQKVTVPVKGHEAGRDDNGSDEPNTPIETVEKTTVDDSQVKEVNPTDNQQGTGIKVNNPDKDTKVTAKDEDGKNIPVVINPTTGEVEVTPGTDVDGPIIVTITDPELPGGKKVVVVPVKGHAAGRDDNGSDTVAAPSDNDQPAQPASPQANTVKPGHSGHGNQVAQPVHTNTAVHAATTKANQPSANKASSAKVQSQLPQTGAVAGIASSLALALIGAGSILALGKRRKED
ncbi:Rib/alpha-like domain-containing protein [Aerococcus mictus]